MPYKEKDFNGFNHHKGKVDLTHLGPAVEARPTEVHLKEDGAIDDGPSLTFVSLPSTGIPIVSQITVKMLKEGLADIGYKIEKIL